MSNNSVQYGPAKLKKFSKILEERLAEVEIEKQSLQEDQKAQKEHIVNTNVDFNENSKHFQQQAKNRRLIRRLQTKSRELRAALKRVDNGNYGVCERTGQLIREERLEVMPTARFDIKPRK